MSRKKPIFYNALLLTGVNLLLRFVGTSFQVFLSGKIGAAGIGLLQLVLSVGALSMTVGMGGIRTATMYLSAEAVGQQRNDRITRILSGCIIYSLVLSCFVGALLYTFAPWIARIWIGDVTTIGAVRLLASFLPVNCLCGVMVGYFTGVNRIGILAVVEVAEQLFSMAFTVLLLTFWAGSHVTRSCLSVIMGSGMGACFTLVTLLFLKRKESSNVRECFPVWQKLWETAVPLAIADDVKAGISTTENLMVPKRLALFPGESTPLATYGMVCGMVFPVLMFPTAILFGLAELMIPELARCNAAGSITRIRHLSERSLLIALVYGCFCGGILFLSAENLCITLYSTPEAGQYLRLFSILAPMLYCDAIVDAMTKGLGQQKICVRNNIITSAMDVVMLFILLPRYGMSGYFFSFLVTHLVNFLLSIRLLRKMVGKLQSTKTVILCAFAVICSVSAAQIVNTTIGRCIAFSILLPTMLRILGIIGKADLQWFSGLLLPRISE